MGQWYDRADVYMNASDIDNMPNSIIEAFACGLPVVTTRAGGIPYVVEQERNGLLVNLGDHEGLAAAALRLLDDGALAQRVISEGLRDVEQQYTWAAVSDRWATLYRRLVRARELVTEPTGRNAETDAAGLLPEASTR
jgi:glycosyltransferase involved in cell wall biosynthesis